MVLRVVPFNYGQFMLISIENRMRIVYRIATRVPMCLMKPITTSTHSKIQ